MRVVTLTLGISLILVSRAALPAAAAGEFRFVRLGPPHGLAHNSTSSVIQDSQGFIWIATDDGLNRYDGYGFEHYRLDAGSEGSNVFKKLHEDSRGELWVGSRSGLLRFDRSSESFEPIDLGLGGRTTSDSQIRAIEEDSQGRLWIAAGPEIFLRAADTGTFRHLGSVAPSPEHAGEFVLALKATERGAWVLSGDHAFRMTALSRFETDGSRERIEHSEQRVFGRALYMDADDELWFSAARLGPTLPSVTARFPQEIPWTAGVEIIRRADDGSLWIGTTNGLYRMGTDGALEYFELGDSFQEQCVLDLQFDRVGSLWIATLAGVLRHDPGRSPFEHLTHDPSDASGLSGATVSTVLEDPDGVLWVGTFGGGLSRVDRAAGRVDWFRSDPSDPTSLCDNEIWESHLDEAGRLWLGTPDGVCLFEPQTRRFRRLASPLLPEGPADVRRIDASPGGRVLIGLSTRGLFEVDPATFEWRLLHREEGNLQSLEMAGGSKIWAGYATGVVLRVDRRDGSVERFELATAAGERLSSLWIYDLLQAADESLWLATARGLLRFWPDTGVLQPGIAADELAGTVCFSIEVDDHGKLWIGTNRGLARIDPSAPHGQRVREFGRGYGVGSVEFNRGAVHKSPSGELFFGGMTGLTFFHPERLESISPPPPVVLTDVSVLGDSGERDILPGKREELTLTAQDYSLSLQFAALDYLEPSSNRYAYRMEGLDPEWVDSGSRRLARYTSLPPGSYTFQVKAWNAHEGWQTQAALLPVLVEPPYWKTWWFRLAAVALVAGLLSVAYRLRVRRLLELERVRLRIATDLHDELGGELSSIALSSSIASRTNYLREPERRRLEEIEATSNKVASGLRDIVWYINPEHDSLTAMARRMRESASMILGDLEWTLQADSPAGTDSMTMVARRDLYLIFKEALTNIARHAQATRVTIRLERHGDRVRLEIEDDGVGFEDGDSADGVGIRSMRRRAKRVAADLEIVSEPGGGTRIRLDYPVTRSRGGARA